MDLFAEKPTITNKEASHLVGNIKERTVSNYLKRARFTRKFIVDEHETYTNERLLIQVQAYCRAIDLVPLERRVYMDESFVYDNEARKRGRSL